jgi:hypothetical protein
MNQETKTDYAFIMFDEFSVRFQYLSEKLRKLADEPYFSDEKEVMAKRIEGDINWAIAMIQENIENLKEWLDDAHSDPRRCLFDAAYFNLQRDREAASEAFRKWKNAENEDRTEAEKEALKKE